MSRPGLFVTGTDTGVGKTRVASAIARSLTDQGRRVGVLKPVATGAERVGEGWRVEDAEALIEAIGGGVPVERVSPLVFEEPLAPPVAARREGRPLSREAVEAATREALAWWFGRGVEGVLVEGVGGLLCPLAEGSTVADLAIALDFPLVIVARRGLGTLNHTLLTVEAATGRGLRIAAIVLNTPEGGPEGVAERTNAEELARWLPGIGIVAELPHASDEAILSPLMDAVNWWGFAAPPRSVEPSPT